MNRYQSAFPIAPPAVRDNINYPGVPLQPGDEPPPIAARTTSRAIVQYEIYVLQYSGRQFRHTFIMAFGIVLALIAILYLDGHPQQIAIAIAIAFVLAAAVGYLTTANAHATFTRDLAVATSETWHPRPAAPPPATVRPFVPSTNPDGHTRTTNTGRLDFTPQVWQSFFNRALANGGFINRDDVAKRALPRRWYYGEGYGQLLEELTRLEFIDGRNRLTLTALDWYEKQIPLPLAAFPARPRTGRTDERTDGAHGAIEVVEEWGGA